MSELPETVIVKGFIYRLNHIDFPDEGNYNISYSGGAKWPRKKVLLQYSESSREKCIQKAWKKLLSIDYKELK